MPSRSKSPGPRRRAKKTPKKSKLRKIFDTLDSDGSGTIDFDELQEGLESIGINLPERKIRAMIETADVNNDDEIDFEEFTAVCESSKKWAALSRSWAEMVTDLVEAGEDILEPIRGSIHRNVTVVTKHYGGASFQTPSGGARLGAWFVALMTMQVINAIFAGLAGTGNYFFNAIQCASQPAVQLGVENGPEEFFKCMAILGIQTPMQKMFGYLSWVFSLAVPIVLAMNGYGHVGHFILGFKVINKNTGEQADFCTLWCLRTVVRYLLWSCTFGILGFVELSQVLSGGDGMTDGCLGTQVVLAKSTSTGKTRRARF